MNFIIESNSTTRVTPWHFQFLFRRLIIVIFSNLVKKPTVNVKILGGGERILGDLGGRVQSPNIFPLVQYIINFD